jgi:hypothetical protein
LKLCNRSCVIEVILFKGWWSTAWNLFAPKPVFQSNLQIRSLVFDIYQKKKNFSKEIEIELFQ